MESKEEINLKDKSSQELYQTSNGREKELNELREKAQRLEESQAALLNMLEDTETLRKVAEDERNKTLTIITNFADGLLVFDLANKLILANPQVEKFLEIESSKIVGKDSQFLSEIPNFGGLISLIGKEVKKIFRKELKVNDNLTLEVSTIPMFRDEENLGTLVTLHDITREKMIEAMKSEFVSISAHQLRTPLSAIKWTMKMMLDGDVGVMTKEQVEFLEKIYKSNERMIALINDLLDVTRIEEGKYLYKLSLIDMDEVVQSAVDIYKEEAKKRKIDFDFKKTEKKLPKINVDAQRIRLVIQNLMENAIRYTKPEGKIVISLKGDKNGIEFSVKDDGVGIPENQQGRIFSKFFRGANVIRMETEGSGLGLFITKNIVDAHGGKISFKSKEGQGTTFSFSLPFKE